MQQISVRGQQFYVCQYTGALVKHCYFLPTGKNLKKKEGCFASLPILLRHYLDLELDQWTPAFEKLKSTVEQYYNQPNIPVAYFLSAEQIPLSKEELYVYAHNVNPLTGISWLENVPGYVTTNKKLKK